MIEQVFYIHAYYFRFGTAVWQHIWHSKTFNTIKFRASHLISCRLKTGQIWRTRKTEVLNMAWLGLCHFTPPISDRTKGLKKVYPKSDEDSNYYTFMRWEHQISKRAMRLNDRIMPLMQNWRRITAGLDTHISLRKALVQNTQTACPRLHSLINYSIIQLH